MKKANKFIAGSRVLTLFLALAILFSAVTPSFVYATGDAATTVAAPTLTVDNATVLAGETFTVNAVLSDNPGINAMNIYLEYSPELELISATDGDLFFDTDGFSYMLAERSETLESGCNFLWYTMDEPYDLHGGTLLTLEFKVSESAKTGKNLYVRFYHTAEMVTVYKPGAASEPIDLQIVGGEINVIDYIPGDVNMDKKINVADVVDLANYLVNKAPEGFNEYAADVTGDGMIASTDLTNLAQFIVGGHGIVLYPSPNKPSCEHVPVAVDAVAATCSKSGMAAHFECSLCGALFTDATGVTEVSELELIIPATGAHAFGDWIISKEADCTTAGVKTRSCADCGVVEEKEIPKTAHVFGEWVITKPATATEAGEKQRTCTLCNMTQTSTIPATSASAWNGTTKLPGYEDIDFDGKTFTIAAYQDAYDGFNTIDEVYPEGTDSISVAVNARNDYIKTLYNCDIRVLGVVDPRTIVAAEITAGQSTIDIYPAKYDTMLAAAAGRNYNLHQYLDLSQSWWDSEYVASNTIKNNKGVDSLYNVVGDFAFGSRELTHVMFINEDALANANIGKDASDLYEMVKNGTWTLDVFHEIMNAVSLDNDGDGRFDKITWASTSHGTHGLLSASGLAMIENTNGVHSFVVDDNVTAWTSAVNLAISTWKHSGHSTVGYTKGTEGIASGEYVFYSDLLRYLSEDVFRNSESTIGVLPYPKHSEAQKGYSSYVDNHLMAYGIPVSVSDVEQVANFFTIYAAHSQAQVTPVWKSTYANQYLNNPDASAVLDLILASRTYDPGYFGYSSVGISNELMNMVDAGNNRISRFVTAQSASIESAITAYVAQLCEHDNLDFVAEVPATCVATGVYAHYTCTDCGKNFESANGGDPVYANKLTIPVTDHTYGDWTVTVQPTPTSEGERVRYCTVCKAEQRETLPAETLDWNGTTKLPGYENIDFGGRTFTIAVYQDAADGYDTYQDIYSDGTDAVSVAVRDRNATMEALYNCKIATYATQNASSIAKADIGSGQSTFDIYASKYNVAYAATGGINYNLRDYVNLSAPGWDQKYVSQLTLRDNNGHDVLYSIIGDFAPSSYDTLFGMYFNEDAFDRAGVKDADGNSVLSSHVYEMVKNGTWTMDKFLELYTNASKDNNNDGLYDYDPNAEAPSGDVIGWVTSTTAVQGLYTAAGLPMIRNDNGALSFAVADELDAWNEVIDTSIHVWHQPQHADMGYQRGLEALISGNAIFFSEVMKKLKQEELANSDIHLGFLPYPKYSENQEYATFVEQHLAPYSMPLSVLVPNVVGDFFTLFAAHSSAQVMPVWKDTLRYEALSSMGAEVLDITLASRTYDLGYYYASSDISSVLSNYVTNGNNNLTAYLDAQGQNITNRITNYVTTVTNNSTVIDVGDCTHTNLQYFTAMEKNACFSNGHIEHWFCHDCGAYFITADATTPLHEKQIVIPADAHNMGAPYILQEPTETQIGIYGSTCNVCDMEIVEEGGKLAPLYTRLDFGTASAETGRVGNIVHDQLVNSLRYNSNYVNVSFTSDSMVITALKNYDGNNNYFVEIDLGNMTDTIEPYAELNQGFGTWQNAPLSTNYRSWQGRHQFMKLRVKNNTDNNIISLMFGRNDNPGTYTNAVAMYLQGGAPTEYGNGNRKATPSDEWQTYIYDMVFQTALGRDMARGDSNNYEKGVWGYLAAAERMYTRNAYHQNNWNASNGNRINTLRLHFLGAYAPAKDLNGATSYTVIDTRDLITQGDTIEIDYMIFGGTEAQVDSYKSNMEAGPTLAYASNGDGTCTVTGIGTVTDTDIVIPATFEGLPVTAVKDHAFTGSNIVSVTFETDEAGNGVRVIGEGAFSDCYSLTSVTLPDTLISIEHYAFTYDEGLTNISIPEGVTFIGEEAFEGTGCLGSIQVPNTLEVVGWNAFGDGSALNLTEHENGLYLGNSTNPYHVLVGVADSSVTAFAMHEDTKIVYNNALFDCLGLTQLELPEGLRSIGAYMIRNKNIKTLAIPASVVDIQQVALIGLLDLDAVTVAVENPVYASIDNGVLVSKAGDVLYHYPAGRNGVFTMGASIVRIDTAAFASSKLTALNLSEGLKYIGQEAFSSMSSLKTITIPASVTEIEDNPFMGCTALSEIAVAEGNAHYVVVDGVLYSADMTRLVAYPAGKEAEEYIVPDTVRTIWEYAFYDLTNTKRVVLGSGVEYIGWGAFYGNDILERVTILNPNCVIETLDLDEVKQYTICGYEGSTAQTFANENDYTFEVYTPDAT